MKFLVIMRPNGSKHGIGKDGKGHTEALKKAIKSGAVESAYAFIGGGAAYVVKAKDTYELAGKVRYNPLFDSCSVEVIPVADAVDFLEAAHRQTAPAAKKK